MNKNLLTKLITPQTALLCGVLFFLFSKLLLLLLHHDIRWDEAVYLSMGKYVFSGGMQGFWETLRPPLWPLFLGFFWFIGDAVLLGELFVALFGVTGPILLYLTLKPYLDEWLAVGAGLLLLFSDIWFWNSSMLLTGLPSAAIIIFAFYAYTKNKHFIVGILCAGAFLVRFPAGLGLAAILATHLTLLWPHRSLIRNKLSLLKPLLYTVTGFCAPVFFWLVLNAVRYREQGIFFGALAPLIQGSGNVFFDNTWLHNTQPLFYVTYLLVFMPIVLFALFGVLRARERPNLLPYAFLAGFTFLFFTLLPNNQTRFALLILPGLVVLTVLGIEWVGQKKNSLFTIATALLFVNVMLLGVYDTSFFSHRGPQPAPLETDYYHFLQDHPVTGTILTADPVVAWYAPNPARVMYYEFLYDYEKFLSEEVAAIFFVPRSMPCHPQDVRCRSQRLIITQHIIQNYDLVHVTESGGFHYFIFSNQINLPPLDTDQVYEELIYVSSNPQ